MFGLKESNGDVVLRALGKSSAIIEFTPEGVILTANENFLNVMGYKLEDVVGQYHRIFVEPKYAESQDYQNFWQLLRDGKHHSRRFQRFGKGGKEVWIQACYSPVLDSAGRVVKVVKLASDITNDVYEVSVMRAQVDAINKSNAVIHFDTDGVILKANENFLKTMGYSLDEIVGKHHRMFVDMEYGNSSSYKSF